MTGKAIVAVGNGKVEIRDIKVPRVDEWDIRVALERSAISAGTESHVARSIANINKPLVLGYAPIGRIEAVGEKAAALFAVGDRVSYFCPSPSAAGPDNCSGGHQSPAVLNVIRFRETYSGLINTASKYPMAYPRNTQHLVV